MNKYFENIVDWILSQEFIYIAFYFLLGSVGKGLLAPALPPVSLPDTIKNIYAICSNIVFMLNKPSIILISVGVAYFAISYLFSLWSYNQDAKEIWLLRFAKVLKIYLISSWIYTFFLLNKEPSLSVFLRNWNSHNYGEIECFEIFFALEFGMLMAVTLIVKRAREYFLM